jgi:hypothetical protein
VRTVFLPVWADGPLVPVEVTLPWANLQALRAAASPVPAPVTIQALIDTGADVTVLDPAVLAPLIAAGLQPSRFVFVNSPAVGGMAPTTEYFVGLTVAPVAGQPRSGLVLRNHPVVERAVGTLGYQALIGRDVLDQCVLVYDGPGRRVTVAF